MKKKSVQFWYLRKIDMENSLRALQNHGIECIPIVKRKKSIYGRIVFSYRRLNYGITYASNYAVIHEQVAENGTISSFHF